MAIWVRWRCFQIPHGSCHFYSFIRSGYLLVVKSSTDLYCLFCWFLQYGNGGSCHLNNVFSENNQACAIYIYHLSGLCLRVSATRYITKIKPLNICHAQTLNTLAKILLIRLPRCVVFSHEGQVSAGYKLIKKLCCPVS